MTKEEALSKVNGYLTSLLPSEEYSEVEEIINILTQEPNKDKIIDDHYWKGFHNGIRTEKWRENKREACEDAVSREAAKEAVENTIAKYIPVFVGRYERIPLEVAMAIKCLPPVTPAACIAEIKFSKGDM